MKFRNAVVLEALRLETRVIQERFLLDPGRKRKAGLTGLDLMGVLDSLKGALSAKVYRQAVIKIGRSKV